MTQHREESSSDFEGKRKGGGGKKQAKREKASALRRNGSGLAKKQWFTGTSGQPFAPRGSFESVDRGRKRSREGGKKKGSNLAQVRKGRSGKGREQVAVRPAETPRIFGRTLRSEEAEGEKEGKEQTSSGVVVFPATSKYIARQRDRWRENNARKKKPQGNQGNKENPREGNKGGNCVNILTSGAKTKGLGKEQAGTPGRHTHLVPQKGGKKGTRIFGEDGIKLPKSTAEKGKKNSSRG